MSRLRGAFLVKDALAQLRQEICVSAEKATPELLALLPEQSNDGVEWDPEDPLAQPRGRSTDNSTLQYQPYSKLFSALIDRLVRHLYLFA